MQNKEELALIKNVNDHTMQQALYPYIEMKIHPLISEFTGRTIIIRGKYDRVHSHIGKEKKAKHFNWKRPTAELSTDRQVLYLDCFPGREYVYHYANLVGSYLALKDRQDIQVVAELPTIDAAIKSLLKTNILQLPPVDIVIMGTVEKLHAFMPNHTWQGEGDFHWLVGVLNSKRIALLGCEFSYWGDIAGNLVQILATKGVKTVIYTGKVGGLKNWMQPNSTLATGSASILDGKELQWSPILCIPKNSEIVEGVHVTLPSVLMETKEWLANLPPRCSFVDPEIGPMAKAAIKNNLNFGYLHLISDNVASMGGEHLGNEREDSVLNKRQITHFLVLEILYHSILKLCNRTEVNMRFFKSATQQLKTETSLKDTTPAAPYGPGAMVLFR